MAFADFLFSGSPGASATSYGTSSTQLPGYLEDYGYGILSSAAGLASQPYQPYPGARVAPMNDDQNRAIQNARQEFDAAPWLNFLNSATGSINAAQQINPYELGKPYLEQSAGIDSRTGAQGDLTSARQTFPGAVDQYMSPYIEGVTDNIARLGTRNWEENILPGVNDVFTRSGQYGSTRHADIANRAGRDVANDILGQQSTALQAGYGQAGQLFNQDASRALGTATASAGIDENYARRLAETGNTMGALGTATAGLNLSAAQQQAQLAEQRQRQGQSAFSSLYNTGALAQGQEQKGLDLAYQDFQNQRQYPYDQLGFLSNIQRGLPYSSSSYTMNNAPAGYNPSIASQVAGGAAGLYGLSQLAGGMKRGGPVRVPPRRPRGALSMTYRRAA